VSQRLLKAWYDGHPLLWLLWPLSWLYGLVTATRRFLYRTGLLTSKRFPVPIIVVGNITVGGTGKTPLTLALIDYLRAQGYRPGVVSRGYGGRTHYPCLLNERSTAAMVGDEPLALFQRTGVPVVVDPVRVRAVDYLLQQDHCDVVLCDDGLQHYALHRDIEIAVVDGARGLGNKRLLPSGPLRERPSRLQSVDFVVVNGDAAPSVHGFPMRLQPQAWRSLLAQADSAPNTGSRIHAVAGIGNPQRFFSQLQAEGYDVVPHAFADHHAYTPDDLCFTEPLPVVMTEKDAVKCMEFAAAHWWYVPVQAELPQVFWKALMQRLHLLEKHHAG
jgi:tetraacyldisaccharide 4'-kinase